jgi:DNA-binding transcriptional LysR family regulator
MRCRMDWRSVKFDWNRARAFLVTAEEGSLSAAARALAMSQPTLGRQVDALERELGVALFERVGRGLTLTPAGLALLDHVRTMGDAALRVSLTASGRSQSIEGPVVITASEIYSAFLLPPVIARLRREHPGVTVEIVASNATLDLRRREADIAIRNVRPSHPDLVARKIRDDTAQLYASPSYLARLGPVDGVEDLKRADFIGFDTVETYLTALVARGVPVDARNFPIVTANHLVHWEMAKHGLGIGAFPEAIAARETGLAKVLPTFPPIVYPIWLTAHRELETSRRLRIVFDILAEELASPAPPLSSGRSRA